MDRIRVAALQYFIRPVQTFAQFRDQVEALVETAGDSVSQAVVGMAASLIVLWDDYEIRDNWRDFTDGGMFTDHDPQHGRTLYGAVTRPVPRPRFPAFLSVRVALD